MKNCIGFNKQWGFLFCYIFRWDSEKHGIRNKDWVQGNFRVQWCWWIPTTWMENYIKWFNKERRTTVSTKRTSEKIPPTPAPYTCHPYPRALFAPLALICIFCAIISAPKVEAPRSHALPSFVVFVVPMARDFSVQFFFSRLENIFEDEINTSYNFLVTNSCIRCTHIPWESDHFWCRDVLVLGTPQLILATNWLLLQVDVWTRLMLPTSSVLGLTLSSPTPQNRGTNFFYYYTAIG